MKTKAEIKAIKDDIEQELLSIPGVTGVDIQEKESKGKLTGELSIQVYVKKKKPLSKLKENEKIPRTIEGVKTDVKEEIFFAHYQRMSITDLRKQVDTTKYSTLKGGISIGPCRSIGGYIYVGTLGCMVRDRSTNQKMMLSNFHVMSVDNSWSVGDTLAQPARNDGGNCPTDVVGSLQRATLNSSVDAAVATINGRPFSCEIQDIGEVKGKANAVEDAPVRKRGRTTELTYGKITSTNLSVNVDYDSLGVITLTNQIRIEVDPAQSAAFGLSGDSGSVVVDQNDKVVGLYFAGNGSGSIGIANHIQDVLDEMDVEIHTCTVTKPIKEFGKEIGKGEFKEKNEKIEIKEWKERKEFGKGEFKEFKERKEFHKGEIKEWKELKEKDKDLVEDKFFERPDFPGDGPGDLLGRLNSMEREIQGLRHFISSEERPDLSKGALRNE